MTAFVTGGTGFVGSHLVEELLKRGTEVRCLVRDRAKAERLFPAGGPEFVAGDLDNTGALEAGCRDADTVFHVAGLVAARSETEMHQVNVDATARVLRAAERTGGSGVRFVYVSSLAAAGPAARGRVLEDPDAAKPVTNYGRAKLAGERLVRYSDFQWTVVRPPAVYGPRDTEMFKVFKLARYGIGAVFGDGGQELSLIHACDLATALVAAAGPECGRKSYYAAHPEVVTQRELVKRFRRAVAGSGSRDATMIPIPGVAARFLLGITAGLARVARKATLLTPDKANEFLAPAWTCSAAALERDTGWSAVIGLAAGADATAAWYREHGWL